MLTSMMPVVDFSGDAVRKLRWQALERENPMEDLGSILIVDDNQNNLQVLMGLLGAAGYKVRPALSGEIALRAVEASPPDLILLDVRMPGMDGYETCRRLKASERGREVPVIFISALQDTEDKLIGFRSGGVDYVAKPFQAEEVLARVRSHIQLHRMQRQLERMVQERTRELSESEARYRVLFADSPVAIMVFDSDDLKILAVNSAFTRVLGHSAEESVGRSLDFAVVPEQRTGVRSLARQLTEHSEEAAYTDLLRFSRRDGEIVDIEGVLQRVDYPGHRAQILMLQDVTESRRAEERLRLATKEHQRQLEKSVYHDVLTGLPNRTLFAERMRQGVEKVHHVGCWMVVCYLDIDAFKAVNVAHGREVGDQVLIRAGECLRACLGIGDTLARIGGDEFALLLLGLKNNEELDHFLLGLQAQLAQVAIPDGVSLSASIGVAIYPQDHVDPDTLLRHADQAMLLAKQGGKGRYHRFDPESDKRVRAKRESVERMRAALTAREFVLYYQPKVDLRSGVVIGAEALIRWRHPVLGLLPPGAFLPEIEGDDFMVELGHWVIEEALRQMARWRGQGLDLAVSVNVAGQQLVQCNFVDRLRDLLAAYPDTPAGRLELEVLETSALDDVGKVERLIAACHDMGIGFSLDDFGTGYSSLTYLRRLSADTLKIDQSFVRHMLDDPGDMAIVSGVIGLAAAFQRKVIAEGVETLAHGKALMALGCTQVQGYGIARPMPAQDLPEWATGWPDSDWMALINEFNGVGGLIDRVS
jgi:diguanylate cyclase (GGDEF)-like protein/PAS domain S-box-containing protein